MRPGANTSDEAGVDAPEAREAHDRIIANIIGEDVGFAVIHDEPFLTIVYDEGVFRGTLVKGTLDGLVAARKVAATYNLEIYHVRVDYHGSFDIYLREVRGSTSDCLCAAKN